MNLIDTLTLFLIALALMFYQGFLAHLSASFFGKYRQIGYNWSYIISFLLPFPLGVILVLFNKRNYSEKPRPSVLKRIIGYGLIILGIYCIFDSYYYFGLSWLIEEYYIKDKRNEDFKFFYEFILSSYYNRVLEKLWGPFFHLGIIAYGYFLTEVSKGKVFNRHIEQYSF